MTLAAEQGGKLVADLAAEPGFARIADAGTPVLLWRSGDVSPVWASKGGRDLLARLPASAEGAPALPWTTLARLRALAEGAAPRAGFRLERLRWSQMAVPMTFATRLVPLDGEDLLVTAVLPADAGRPREAVSGPPVDPGQVPVKDGAVPVPSSATVFLPQPRGRRFAWQTDAEGRFTSVSADLADVVGAGGADVLGRRWEDLVGRIVEDRDGAVAAAWRDGRGWSRRTIGWRDPATERLVPVELSGAPVAGSPSGYRGFGIAYPHRARSVAPGLFGKLPERPRTDAPPAEETPLPTPPAPEPAAPAVAKDGETVFNLLRTWLVPAEATPAGDAQAGALSTSERVALHEIAQTLRDAPEQKPAQVEERRSADIVQLPRTRPRNGESTALLDQLPLGLVVLRDGVPLFANRHVLDRLGFADLPAAVARGALQNLGKLGPEDAAAASVRLPAADGREHAFQARSSRAEWGDLGADFVLLTPPVEAVDSEAEALRLDLAAREGRIGELRSSLDLAADGVVTLDRSARLLSLTRSAERLFGIAANEVVGDSITALIEPRDHRAALACLDALRIGPSSAVQHCEVRGRTRNGTVMPLAMRVGQLEGGEPGFSVAFSDITHFRLLENDLREARAAAEDASANRADFLARISHEVRTPLTAITGFAELMLEERFGPLGNDRYKGYIRDIRDSGIHVISLVNDLLDLAKATSGNEDLHPDALDLNGVVQQCVALATPLAGQEKTIIRTSFPAGLPHVLADERSIRQIVINLLSNAIRFTGAGGQVIVSTAVGGPGEVVLSVRDTGPGMSDEEVETALTPFRQVSSTKRRDGTGLGLPLSKALTEANGGVFVVTSARDLGTLVEVRLPVAGQHAAAAAE